MPMIFKSDCKKKEYETPGLTEDILGGLKRTRITRISIQFIFIHGVL